MMLPISVGNYEEIGEGVMALYRKLEVTRSEKNGIVVLKFDGGLLLGQGADTFSSATRREFEDGKKVIVVDLINVDHADSAGVGAIVEAYVLFKNFKEGRVVLGGLSRKIRDSLTIAKLLPLFLVFEDSDLAVACLTNNLQATAKTQPSFQPGASSGLAHPKL